MDSCPSPAGVVKGWGEGDWFPCIGDRRVTDGTRSVRPETCQKGFEPWNKVDFTEGYQRAHAARASSFLLRR